MAKVIKNEEDRCNWGTKRELNWKNGDVGHELCVADFNWREKDYHFGGAGSCMHLLLELKSRCIYMTVKIPRYINLVHKASIVLSPFIYIHIHTLHIPDRFLHNHTQAVPYTDIFIAIVLCGS